MKKRKNVLQLLAVLAVALTTIAGTATYAMGLSESGLWQNISEKGETIIWLVGLGIAIVLLVIFIDKKAGRH